MQAHPGLRVARRRCIQWPHMHRNGPVGLYQVLPEHREDDFPVGSYQVVVAFLDMWSNNVNVKEGLLDDVFDSLYRINSRSRGAYLPVSMCNLPATY